MSKINIYKASAGSGKTYHLALEYIKELLIAPHDRNYRYILAVTFTKDATGEMMDRILAELYGLAFNTKDSITFFNSLSNILKENNYSLDEDTIRKKSYKILYNILHDYSRLNVTTIDSFFQKVLRNLARELGRGSKYNLEMNTNKVLKEAVHLTIEKANKNKLILKWLTTYIEHRLEEDKSWRIENEIYEFSKCIYNEFFQENEKKLRKQLQGNPHIFTEIKQQQDEIQHQCKVFFQETNNEVLKILFLNNLEAEDFYRKGIVINLFKKLADGNYSVEINKTISECSKDSSVWCSKTHKRRDEINKLADFSLISILQKTLKTFQLFQTSRIIMSNLHQLGLIWDITKEISEQNAENNRFILSDTTMFLNQMIDNSDAPFIYEKLGSEIHHIMIDEFQDTSRLQWKNFKVLLSDIISNDNFSLLVGDVKQSIYRWRNGDWRILNNLEKELNTKARFLEYNYRSKKEIIDFNNSFFIQAAKILDALFNSHFEDLQESPFISAYNEENVIQKIPNLNTHGYVCVDFIAEKKEEIGYSELTKEAVLEKLNDLFRSNIPANEICILTRTNKDIILLAEYLSSMKNENEELAEKYYLDIISNEAFQFNSSPVIKIIIEALKLIVDPGNKISKEQLYYLLKNFNLEFPSKEFEDTAIKKLLLMPVYDLIGHLYRILDLDQIEGQSAYIFSFYDSISKFLNEKPTDIYNFLQYWEGELKTKSISTGTSISGIQAMTIHKSKGLQFHTVIIPYCDWSINPKTNTTIWSRTKENFLSLEMFPIPYSKKIEDTIFSSEYIEETALSWMDNLNLLYVGFTRAKNNLFIISKCKKNLKDIDKISTVGNLLQLSVENLEGKWNEERKRFTLGHLEDQQKKIILPSDNLFKQTTDSVETIFISKNFPSEESIFKQSNKSRDFISKEESKKEKYVSYGNIMHTLLEKVTHWEEINTTLDYFIMEGLILPEEKDFYYKKIYSAIKDANVENWFNGTFKSYQEYSLVTKEEGKVIIKRPDRVLLSDNTTIVIDYKFGKLHNSHQKQVKEYMDILNNMGYPQVKGYLWYFEDQQVLEIK